MSVINYLLNKSFSHAFLHDRKCLKKCPGKCPGKCLKNPDRLLRRKSQQKENKVDFEFG